MVDVRTATATDRQGIEQTLLLSFATDPAFRYLWPRSTDYLTMGSGFMMLGGAALTYNTAFIVGDYEGVSLWLPPGVHGDEDAFSQFIVTYLEGEKLAAIATNHEELDRHKPDTPYWYLSLIGTDPAYQNRGVGSALMKRGLAAVDAQNDLAYLVSTNPKNIRFYQRYGFEVICHVKTGDIPELYPMVRQPQG
ncbi:Mycothiol acetyltransferase [BD1-7 clade bacterium]|uniref:Mycothiol acetyltransferase n=1 Tax=BD1-7 clade bacterium TaxID=2029982 RepID=A0A5S9PR97_9GAMM|nr:Mycothiol acetyltransferase [BD1-7 clade bacterium]